MFCLLLVAFSLPYSVAAQSVTATLSGTVLDERDAVIPGAEVAVVNVGTGARRQTATNEEGYFIVPLLPPGTYVVNVQQKGFAPVEVQNVVLNVGDQKALQIHLKAGDISEMVQITGEAPMIDESPAVATVVDRQFVENLPLNGRSFQALIALTPGIVLTKTEFQNSLGQFSVNGQRTDTNYFTVDGVSANVGILTTPALGTSGAGALPGLTATGGTNGLVSVDALQEFKIQTSTYAPEFGRTPGGQVQILTRSGTNEFRGTVFEYFRNDALDANDWFANRAGLPKPALRQNDFGGVLGGPIIKNRTFFFFSYEGLRLRLPRTSLTLVPSLNARQIASAGIQPFLNAYPVPNGGNLANNRSEFNATYSDPSTLNATSIRIDHTLSDKLTSFGRYNYAPSRSIVRGRPINVLEATLNKTETLTLGFTWAINPNMSNEFRANWSRASGSRVTSMDDFGGAVPPPDSVLFPASSSSQDSLFTFTITGTTGQLSAGRAGSENIQRQINLVDSLMIVKGTHQLKLGIDYRYLSPVKGGRKYSQGATFLNVAQAVSGIAARVAFSTSDRITLAIHNFSAFAQDTWRARRRLTLTYGLRWELNPPPKGKEGKDLFTAVGLDSLATMALAPAGTPLYQTTYNNFAPRIGASYLLSDKQSRETVLRGGFGIFYDLGSGEAASASTAFPYSRANTLRNIPFPPSSVNATPPSFDLNPPVINFIMAFDPNLKLPRTYQWNFSVEQSLSTSQTISASYVGAQSSRLLQQELLTAPNPKFSAGSVTRNTGTSDYHAMQLQFNRRLSKGLQGLASYTWSSAIDTFSLNSFTFGREGRGSSDFDVRHSFNAAVTYNLPKVDAGVIGKSILRNWSVDTIFYARSATPVNLLGGFTFLDSIEIQQRPDLVPGQPLYVYDPHAPGGRRFNRNAFAPPPSDRQGTFGRNVLRGFPAWQVDMALRRQFNLTERINIQLRAEFFNIFNHPNFGDPDFLGGNDISSPFFGESSSMLGRSLGGLNPLYQIGGPRSIQFALKLNF
ncbi:MAG TPA: TonB-dependent receptor [Pyrinomonadaceae bacterium]|nr:TonB-dependent receptor [Pyrinomonadaceae bacterium]